MSANEQIIDTPFFWRFLVPAALLLFSIPSQAQQPRQALHRHVPSVISNGSAVPVGTMSPDQRLNLSIVLPLRNGTELANLLVRLYDPNNPEYHKFLTAPQFTEQFSPSAEDYGAILNFAPANGFTITNTPTNRLLVSVRGRVAQIEKAFHVTT